MYTLDRLFADVVANRGPVLRRGPDDGGYGGYKRVWDALNRYVTEAVEKRQTVNVQNFCKIGYKVEEQGKQGQRARLRPHFQLAENFIRSYGVDVRSHQILSEKALTSIEEFNFTKAAIRYSQNLTKDNIFMGLRAIVQQLGEAIASGESVSVDFEIGTLRSNDREVRFAFAAELYMKEGLSVPEGAVEAGEYRPSVSFAPPSKDALTLNLQGTRSGFASTAGSTVKADGLGGWADQGEVLTVLEKASHAPSDESAILEETQFHPAVSGMPTPLSAREIVHHAALGRHIKEVEREASEARALRDAWEVHLKRCVEEEKKDMEWRKAVAKDHSEKLRVQMQHAEDRRVEAREHTIQQASLHDFPNFREAPEAGFIAYVRERRENLKDDLDQQVSAKQRVKKAAKDRERSVEAYHIEASKRELAALRQEAIQKREADKAALNSEWAKHNYIKTVKKAIQDHHKAPTHRVGVVPELVSGMPGLMADSPRGMGMTGPLSDPGSGSAPPSARRPATGSVRRMPIGAAASLALHKEKLLNGTTRR